MNKKAFVLMETIVVIVVISVVLLTIFASYNKILSKVKTENKYDTSEYIYMTNYVKKYMQSKSNCVTDAKKFNMSSVSYDEPVDFFSDIDCDFDNSNNFKIKKVYILENINSSSDENLKKFDAYMIDYIKKLDVNDSDVLLVVEYSRTSLDDKGNAIYSYDCSEEIPGCSPLTETYIASLRWD